MILGCFKLKVPEGYCVDDDDLGKAEQRELQRSQVLSDII